MGQPPFTTWYEVSSVPRAERPELDFATDADVCVVGGGLAGLTTARELARRGWNVVLLEADRIASGASGRNGGFVLAGFAEGQGEIEKRVGLDHAKALHALSREGMAYVRDAVESTRMPGVALTGGALKVVRHAAGVDAFRAEAERRARFYGDAPLFWPRAQVREVLRTPAYHAGLYDMQAFHIHPLNYCLGLAADAARAGVRLYEHSPAVGLDLRSLRRVVRTAKGAVRCDRIVLCGSAALPPGLHRRVARAVVPVSTFIAVTEPLGERLEAIMRFAGAVTDTRRAGNYFRIVDGSRLMWGSGITTRRRPPPPARLARALARDMARTFPALKGVRIDHAWAGVMGYARHKMPQIGAVERDVWVASAFGGHGLNTTAMAGLVLARALAERDDSYRLFAPFGLAPTHGAAGRLAAQFEYWRLGFQDWLDERRG
ncbi:NAD(P)/FAD-dependent oxidoreductase [Labrys wisconsinensis]|uniref:Gamma-glutamylputrescine oxidase n=1 Tax=Labrys wisconsinensis TaxID=425677 RepID=A0ABU0JFJ1_9HYPH|nr:FAD-binding oxidoreductase [Labrys wisconsinensis]MDQ0473045.1 gamma-glutamylputrescine oxidase [Labrys wisconsinensis]